MSYMNELFDRHRPQLVVAAAIVDDLVKPRQLLTARRSRPPALAGGWEFPGGKVDASETPHAALHRELREELGITVRLGEELPGPADGHWPLGPGLRMRVWWAAVSAGHPAPLEDHDELRWLAAGRWDEVAWLPADLAVVHSLTVATAQSRTDTAPVAD